MSAIQLSRFSVALLALLAALAAHAQDATRASVDQRADKAPALFNWNYAAIYGTGFYSIGDEQVVVARLPLAYRLRSPSETQWGLRLTMPVSTALAQFDLHGFDLGHVNTVGLSALPGIQLEIPMANGWMVKPFANAGKGWEFSSGTTANIWSTGVAANYKTLLGSRWVTGLGAKVTYAGYRARGESSVLGAVSFGADLGYATNYDIRGRKAILGMQLIGTQYFNRLEFLSPGSQTQKVSSEGTIAFTLGAAKPVEFMGGSFDRIGLGYRQGSGGLKGVELVASFPF